MSRFYDALFLAITGGAQKGGASFYDAMFGKATGGKGGITKTAAGAFVSLNDAIPNKNFISLSANIDSSDGITSATVIRTGSNLLNVVDGTYSLTGRTLTVSNGEITCSVTGVQSAVLVPSVSFNSIPIIPAGTYYFDPGVISVTGQTLDAPYVKFVGLDGTTYNLGGDGTITLLAPAYVEGIYDTVSHLWSSGDSYVLRPKITATAGEDFAPYTANKYTISFEGIGKIYVGVIDFVSGELTVSYEAVDLGTLAWTRRSTSARYTATAPADCYQGEDIAGQSTSDISCPGYTAVSAYDGYNGVTDMGISISYWNVANRIQITNTSVTSAEELKTSLNGVYMIYKLAANKTYNLGGEQIKALAGVNNIWSDLGDVSVTYIAAQ